jgi:acetylornithine deacetylase/succinyl-diaminopimelate desuccinylase-like protein
MARTVGAGDGEGNRRAGHGRLPSGQFALAATAAALLVAGVGLAARQGGAARDGTAAPGAVEAAGPIRGDEVVSLLRRYLRIDTSNPPGNEIRAARFFKDLFDREGIASEIFEFEPGRANIVARLPGSGARGGLILSNHMDVVNVERPFWSVDPFGGVLKDGYVYGRGALDMKTTGLLEAVTLINLKRAGGRPARDVVFLGTSDEEVGAAGVGWVLAKRPDLVRGAEFMLNEGGVIDRVNGRARSYNVAVTEKCPFWIKITARGRPGHGSQPFEKDNAILLLLGALDRLREYQTPVRVTPAAEAYFRARAAGEPPGRAAKFRDLRAALDDREFRDSVLRAPELNAILRDTIAITMLQGAPQTNIIPTTAEARVDVRLLPDEDPGMFLKEIKKRVEEPGVTVETIGSFVPATASPVDSDLVRAIDRARARRDPGAVLAPTILTGWTESASLRTLGIKAYGFEPYVLDESEQERAHGNDERISVENVVGGAALMEEIVGDLVRPEPAPTDAAAR